MNKDQSLNNTIVQLIQKHGKKDAIVELLALTHSHSNKNLSIIQDTILYLLQNNHDWLNIIKLLKAWNKDQWGKQFLVRMKKRVNEQQDYKNRKKLPLFEQILYLAEKYWKMISPKKQQFSYENIIDQEIKIEINNIKYIPKIIPKQQTNQKNSRDSTLFNIMKKFPKNSTTNISIINNKQQNQNFIKNNKQIDKLNLQDQYPHLKYIQSRKKITLSPQKSLLDKKHIKVKYSNSKEKKKKYIKDQFSFSTIRQQQKQISFQQNEDSKNFDSIQQQQIIQKELISNKKIQNNFKNKFDQKILDNLQNNNNNFEFDWKQQITNKIINNKKNLQLYTDQQLSFIDFNIKSNNFYLELYKKYKISGLQCLDEMLNQITI